MHSTTTTPCSAAQTGAGYWTCDTQGGCPDCRALAREIDDTAQLADWEQERHSTPTPAAQLCADCGGPTRQAFPTTDAYRACRRCGHVHPTEDQA